MLSDICVESGSAASHSDPHARAQALQVRLLQQGLRQQLLPIPTHADPPRDQAVPLRDLPTKVHPALPPSAAHQDAHRGQALQVQDTRLVRFSNTLTQHFLTASLEYHTLVCNY